jgi:hypothetical protein
MNSIIGLQEKHQADRKRVIDYENRAKLIEEAKQTKIIDGRKIAKSVKVELKERTSKLSLKNMIPGLAVVMVGDRTDTATYVRMKSLKAEELGINFVLIQYPSTIDEQTILNRT